MQVLRISGINNHLLTPNTVIFFHEVLLIYHLLFQEAGITRFINFNFTHHLTNDNLKVLIINLHTLQTVNILYLVYDIFLYSRRTFNGQDVGRSNRTIRQRSSGAYIVVLLNKNLLRKINQVLLHFTGLRCYNDLTVTTFNLTHGNFTIDFRNHSRVGRVTCLKQFCNTRQTTGDITSFTNSARNLHKDVTGLYRLIVFNNNVSTHREVISTYQVTIFCRNMSRRNFCLILRFDNDDFTQTGSFIRFYLISYVLNHTLELNLTGCFSNNNSVERVPFSNQFTLLNHITVSSIQFRTVRNIMS